VPLLQRAERLFDLVKRVDLGHWDLQLACGDQVSQLREHLGLGCIGIALELDPEPLDGREVDDRVDPLRIDAEFGHRQLDVAAAEEVQKRVDPPSGCGVS
jgi:hypothetical protein